MLHCYIQHQSYQATASDLTTDICLRPVPAQSLHLSPTLASNIWHKHKETDTKKTRPHHLASSVALCLSLTSLIPADPPHTPLHVSPTGSSLFLHLSWNEEMTLMAKSWKKSKDLFQTWRKEHNMNLNLELKLIDLVRSEVAFSGHCNVEKVWFGIWWAVCHCPVCQSSVCQCPVCQCQL